MISDLGWSERNREWVGMDVDIVDPTEEDEANSMLDTGKVSEGEGDYQNADKQEGGNSRSMGADLQENTGLEQQLASGEDLSEPKDSVIENPLENIDGSKEISVPDVETRGEDVVDSESAHVIVDEDVDFDQFGAPPPDFPVIGDFDNVKLGGIGSPDGEKGSCGRKEVKKLEDQITGLDADNVFERDESSFYGALGNLNTKREEEGCAAQEELQKRSEELNKLTQECALHLEEIQHQVDLSNAQLHEQYKIHEELKRIFESECDERLENEATLMVLHEILPNMEEKLRILSDQVQFLEFQLVEQATSRNELENDLQQELNESTQYMRQLGELTRLHDELAKKLHEEREGRFKSEAGLMVLGELFTNTEDTMKDLRDQVDSLVVQLQEETELRNSLEEKLDWEYKERMQHMRRVEEQSKMHEDFALKIEEERDERLKSETYLEELRESMSNKEEKLKDLRNQVVLLTAQLQEQNELKKELEGKSDHEREEIMQDAVNLPVSSMPWSEEKLEFEKLMDEQKALLANQVQEAELLKNAAEMKMGLLNHQVQNLEVLTDVAETMEYAFSAKERVIKQTLWTALQALCLGVGLMSFAAAYRDPLRSSLQPT